MKNKFQLSRELKHKIKTELVFSMETPVQTVEYAGHRIALPTPTIITGEIELDENEKHLYNEVVNWLTQYDIPVDVGRFKGLYPTQMNDYIIMFTMDYIEQESWKDWFIDDDL